MNPPGSDSRADVAATKRSSSWKKVGQCLFPLFKHSELLQVCLHREVVNYIFLFQVERDINKLFAAKGSENMGTQISSRDPSSQKKTFFRKLREQELFCSFSEFLKRKKIGKQGICYSDGSVFLCIFVRMLILCPFSASSTPETGHRWVAENSDQSAPRLE